MYVRYSKQSAIFLRRLSGFLVLLEFGMQTSDDFQKQVLDRLGGIENDLEKLDYKFDTYRNASDKVERLATTVIIAAASVVVLSPLLPKVVDAVAALSAK